MVLGALSTLLGLEPDLEVVGVAVDGDDALRLVGSLRPDVLVTDIEMPGRTALDVAAEIRRRGLPARVVILTTFARSGYLRRALDAGVRGYLLKDAPFGDPGRRHPHRPQRGAGGRPCPRRRCMVRARPAHRAGASGAAPGWGRAGNADISASLHLSEGTVRNYLSEAMRKLGAPNRTAAARLARERGWL